MTMTQGRPVRAHLAGPASGLIAQALLLAVLAGTVGLGAAGWVVGLVCAVTMAAVLARGLERSAGDWLGPAAWVTLFRGTLAVGVAALAADSFARNTPVALLVTFAAVALALDLIDGWLARRTGTASDEGARFDAEIDAFLILALSLYVAQAYGAWVLLVGVARYVFLAGERWVPWMRAPLPARRWRKVVAATQGVVLTVAASGVLPRTLTEVVVGVALAALAASMGECVWWLWRRRHDVPDQLPERDAARGPVRTGIAVAVTVLALVVVWLAAVAPDQPGHFSVGAFVRLPLELLVLVALAVLLPATPRRVLAVIAGAVLSAIVVVKLLNIGFFTAFDRPFKPVDDSRYLGIGIETLRDGIGTSHADFLVALVGVLVLLVLAIPAVALLRVTRVAAGHRDWALRAAAVLGVAWVAFRLVGAPVASSSAAALAVDEVQAVQAGLKDRVVLDQLIAHDRFRATLGSRMLRGLRGKDVLLVFVESYGRVAVHGSSFAPQVDAVLRQGNAQLRSDGFAARSAYLTSPTFGGLSWLAHSTMQSGIKVDGQRRYDQLVQHNRLTLTAAFGRAGWRTVADMPMNHRKWPEATGFYHYDKTYDRRTLGFRGRISWPPLPDQFAMLALQRLELAKPHRKPLFAEVDLTSSHAPWTRIPQLIPWDKVGDGTIFNNLPLAHSSKVKLFGDSPRARAGYAQSIEYSLRTLFSFLQRYGDKNTVVVMLGDHQPATTVSGEGASHDVPISIIARDPKVLDQVGGWRWQDGLLPSPKAPVWPMESFRDRFLTAFGSTPVGN